jgi:apolipoprotein N-acyltransferase
MSKVVTGVGDFSTGKGYIPLVMNGHRMGTLICYEAIFPAAGRSYKRAGADMLVNLTNDAWYGRTSAPYQHLSMTTLRAVENRLFLIRAANTGISAIIDPAGRIISQTALFTRTHLRGQVKFIAMNTFYARHGDVFTYTCIALLIVSFLTTTIMRRNRYDRRIT